MSFASEGSLIALNSAAATGVIYVLRNEWVGCLSGPWRIAWCTVWIDVKSSVRFTETIRATLHLQIYYTTLSTEVASGDALNGELIFSRYEY